MAKYRAPSFQAFVASAFRDLRTQKKAWWYDATSAIWRPAKLLGMGRTYPSGPEEGGPPPDVTDWLVAYDLVPPYTAPTNVGMESHVSEIDNTIPGFVRVTFDSPGHYDDTWTIGVIFYRQGPSGPQVMGTGGANASAGWIDSSDVYFGGDTAWAVVNYTSMDDVAGATTESPHITL